MIDPTPTNAEAHRNAPENQQVPQGDHAEASPTEAVAQPLAPAVDLDEKDLRPHIYDGIQEYDKRLPNWWLFTLYGAIAFSFVYWAVWHRIGETPNPGQEVVQQIEENRKIAERNSGVLSNDLLWQMSHETATVEAGKATFTATCASCHQADLSGLIGPNLKDHGWIHGGEPMEVLKVVTDGVLAKGMPAWGPVLGKQKVTEVVAFILSFHQRGEPAIKVDGWTPGSAPVMAKQ